LEQVGQNTHKANHNSKIAEGGCAGAALSVGEELDPAPDVVGGLGLGQIRVIDAHVRQHLLDHRLIGGAA
jgi:hypothetical protein